MPTAEPTPTATPGRTRTPRPTPVPRADIEIVEFGFTRVKDNASFAVIVRNPNPATYVADSVPLQFTFYDDDGPLSTEEGYVSYVLPGQVTATSGTAYEVGRPTRMEVRIGSVRWTEVDFAPGRFEISDVRTRDQQYGGHRTTGTITSEFQSRQEFIRIVAVYRNAAGEVIGGDFTFLDFLDPESEAVFEISTFEDLPGLDATEIYWQL
ncbi:hypothetical protein BH23CHL7_BH23CHL7_05010 [soil metagenome]